MLPSLTRSKPRLNGRNLAFLAALFALAVALPTFDFTPPAEILADDTRSATEAPPEVLGPVDNVTTETTPKAKPTAQRLSGGLAEGAAIGEELKNPDKIKRLDGEEPAGEDPFNDPEPRIDPEPVVRKPLSKPAARAPRSVAKAKPRKIEYLPPPSQAEQKILDELAEQTDIDVVELSLTDFVDYLKDKSRYGIEIQLDEQALAGAGVVPDVPVTRSMKRVKLSSALQRILQQLDLTYIVDDDVLLITTKEKASETLVTRTYPVGDLVDSRTYAPAPVAEPPKPQPQEGASAPPEVPRQPSATKPITVLYQVGGFGFGVVPGAPAPQRLAQKGPATTARKHSPLHAMYAPLVEAITSTVSPDTWDDTGGEGAIAIVPESKSLVIVQTHAVHEKVLQLLRALRDARQLENGATTETTKETWDETINDGPAEVH